MLYQLHFSTQTAGCAPDTGRVTPLPLKKYNTLARSIALVLMSGSLFFPSAVLAATLTGVKYQNLDSDPSFSTGDNPYKNHQVMVRNNDTGDTFRTSTGDNGEYKFNNLPVGSYTISTSFPTGMCLISNLQHPGFTGINDVKTINLGFGSCQQPLKSACDEPTHTSIATGDWNNPNTWNTGTVPKSGDRVKIEESHSITVPNSPIVLDEGSFCNYGSLTSVKGAHTACGISASSGGNIVIFAREIINQPSGVIEAGNGGNTPLPPDTIFSKDTCNTQTALGWQHYWSLIAACGDRVPAKAGNGGNIELFTTNTVNDGSIWAGNGGNAAAAHASAIAGNGGIVKIITNVTDESNTSRTLPITAGDAGKACGNSTYWTIKHGSPGDVEAELKIITLDGTTGSHWKGKGGGDTLYWDPIRLKAVAGLKISGYSNLEIYTDEGGSIDLTALAEGAISAETIRIQTKALNGTGGTLDLRGLQGKVFTASKKVEIYADTIQTDIGVDIRDLIDSPEISINPGKIAYFVSLTATSYVVGNPDSTINVPFRINNIGTKSDTYTLTASSSSGWTLGTLANVSLKGMEVKTVNLPVTLASQLGASDEISVITTSQTDPSVKREVKLTVQVNLGINSDGDMQPDSLDAFPSDPKEWLDSDKDGIGNNADTDDDNDGMTDEWEAKYPDALSPSLNDAAEDFDKDGATNLQEFKAGTDPTDPNSKPSPVIILNPGDTGVPGSGGVIVPTPKVDLWVADPAPDDGTEPGKAWWIYISPAVWVRNQDDNGTQYQNPIYGQDNFVYVNVKNRGTLPATNTKVEVYRSGASMGRGWPVGWDLVGTATIDELEAGKNATVSIKWDKDRMAAPGHYCFYTRVLNDADPMSVAETNNLVWNTQQNNNIAWRNFDVVGMLRQVTNNFQVNLGNPNPTPATIAVVFDEKENLLQNDGSKVIVTLGADLFKRWQDAGAQGENVKVLGGTDVQLLATPAKLVGIQLAANEQDLPITMRVDAFKPAPGEGTERHYHFITQEVDSDGKVIGGVDYDIITRAQDTDSDGDGVKDVVDHDNDNDGIDDEQEVKFGLNPLGSEDAEGDLDGDGQTNREEINSSSDPTDPKSKVAYYTPYGTIKDKAGNILSGVTVKIGDKTIETDAAGNWEIGGLVEGTYDVVATKDGFTCLASGVELGNQQYLQAINCEPVTRLKAMFSNKQWGPVPQGQNLLYTVTVLNGGDKTATGVALNGAFPAGVTVVKLEGDGATCDLATASCALADLAPGASTTLTLEVGNLPAAGNLFMNSVTLTSNEYTSDVVKSWRKVKPYLSLFGKSVPNPVVMGGKVHYQLNAELLANAPETTATAVKAEVLLPSTVKFLQATASQGTCELVGQKVACSLGDLSVANSDSTSGVTIDIDVELGQNLVQLNAETKIFAANYPEHLAQVKTAMILGNGKVDGIILLDITKSMDDEIAAVKRAVELKLKQQFEGAKPVIALVVFRDDVEIKIVSDDLNLILSELSKLIAEGGGLCPEASAQALDLALDHIKPNGTILFVTDAPPYDGTDIEALKAKIVAKQANFVPIVTTSDCATNQLSSPQ